MATPTLKHGAHRLNMTIGALAAGTASDTSDVSPYDFNFGTYAVYDGTTESVVRGTIVFAANVTGQATNFFAVQVNHYNSAGTLIDQITPFTFSSAPVTATAYVPVDITASASTGGSSGRTLAQGWTLSNGDTIEIKRVSTGTGLASPAIGIALVIGVPN